MVADVSDVAPPRRMSRTDRREALLDAAADLLRRRRPAALTFDGIAEEAGVSATLPYKYFASVDEMAEELYLRLVGPIDDETDAMLSDPERTFADKLRDGITLWCDVIRSDGVLLLRLADDVAHPSLHTAIERRRERAVEVWAAELATAFDVDLETARLLAASITASSIALLRRWLRDRLDRERMIDAFVAMSLGQIEAMAGA